MTSIASLNIKGRVWRFTTIQDDDQGGAVPTGTVLYDPVFARIRSEKPTIALLEQGLETPTIFTALFSYSGFVTGAFEVQHNDQYEVTHPPISPHYGKRFVVIGMQPPSFVDDRRYLRVTLRRFETAHPNNLQ
jgi:hypothetical protein